MSIHFSATSHDHQVDHVVLLLLLLGYNNFVAELLVAHASGGFAIDLSDLVAVLKAGHGTGRAWLHVLDKVRALLDNVRLVQLEAERVDLRFLGAQDN